MKKVTTFILCLFSAGTYAQQAYTIKGTISNIPTAKWVYISSDFTTLAKDSVPVINHQFSYAGKTKEENPVLSYLSVSFLDTAKLKRKLATDFFIEKGNIRIDINGHGFRDNCTVTGTPTNVDYAKYRQLKADFSKKWNHLMAEKGGWEQAPDSMIKRYRKETYELQAGFVRSHPKSFFSLFVLGSDLLRYQKPDTLLVLLNSLAPSLQETAGGKNFRKMISATMVVRENSMAPEFTEKDTADNNIRLSDYKGQYVLVDFWASWCHPCREESPYLLDAYHKYQDKNFTILSVSLDKSKDAWMKAIHTDKYEWTQVSALDPEHAESVLKYGVKAIPRNFLIDPSGKIIAMDLRGKDLEAKLTAIIK